MKSLLLVPLAVFALILTGCSRGDDPETQTKPKPTKATTTVTPNPFDGQPQADLDAALLKAARDDNATVATQLLEAGADTETRDGKKRTPLLLAVTDDNVDVARALAAAGADPDALDDRHDTPWLVTGVTGSVAMAKVLILLEPDLTIRNRYGGISHIPAGERGHDDYVAYVLDNTDIKVDHVNDLGWTSLLEAVILGKGAERWQNIARSLVDHGADVSIADRDGVTALQHARSRGFTELVKILEAA